MGQLTKLEDTLEKYKIENLEEYIGLHQIDNYTQGFINELLDENRRLNAVFGLVKQENIDLKQEIAKLKQKAIMSKFKRGQEVWWIDTRVNDFNEQRYRIESYLIDSIVTTKEQFRYYGDDGLWLGDNELFATKEEAEQKLIEMERKDEKR